MLLISTYRALKNAQAKLKSLQSANAQREQARKAEEVNNVQCILFQESLPSKFQQSNFIPHPLGSRFYLSLTTGKEYI